mgnify:CR=1 FL=1
MAAVINLKVTPDQLQQKARDVSSAVSKMKSDFNKLNTAINSTHSYWVGQAGDLHRKLYNDRVNEVNEILRLLERYPTDLMQMAGIYTKSENQNKAVAATLNSNVIH